MKSFKRAVILVGHGGLLSDIPSEIMEIIALLFKLETHPTLCH